MPAILDALVQHAAQIHETLEIESTYPQAIVAGFPAIGWRGNFQFLQAGNGEEVAVGARSRTYVVFVRGLAFTISLSGSDDPMYYDEAEFEAILRSVRIR